MNGKLLLVVAIFKKNSPDTRATYLKKYLERRYGEKIFRLFGGKKIATLRKNRSVIGQCKLSESYKIETIAFLSIRLRGCCLCVNHGRIFEIGKY